MIEDPQLLQAGRREQWRVGSVVEIMTQGNQWVVGWITAQEKNNNNLSIMLCDSNQKITARANDSCLAVIGTHARLAPPGWEVRPGGPNAPAHLWHQRSGQKVPSLEVAWVQHIRMRNKVMHPVRDGVAAPSGGKGGSPSQVNSTASNARSQASPNGELQVDDLVVRLREKDRIIEEKDDKIHKLLHELSMMGEKCNQLQRERDEAIERLERLQHGVAHRSASQSSLTPMVVSPQLQPSSSAKCITDPSLPPVPTSWQPPQSARDGKCVMPASPGPPDDDDGEDQFPGPDFPVSSYRSGFGLATVPSQAAPSREAEKPVDIVVTVPRAAGPEDLDMSSWEAAMAFKDHRWPHEPCRSVQSLQKPMGAPTHTVQRLPSAPVHSQAFAGQVQVPWPHPMPFHPNFRILASASASVPSAPASLAAPAGGARLQPRPTLVMPQVSTANGYAVR